MKISSIHARCGRASGVALIFVLFLVAVVIIGGSAVTLSVLTQGRREKEADTIWRGEQYERAIGLFYRKFGRFPTSLDNLLKPQNGVRFLREAYKNPMNREDGSWRFIYVTAGGQLIGSVRYTSLQEMAFVDRQRRLGIPTGIPAPGAGTPADSQPEAGGFGSSQPAGFPAMPGTQATGAGPVVTGGGFGTPIFGGASPSQAGANGAQASPGAGGAFGQNPAGGLSVNETAGGNGTVIGGFIIGVAGKGDKASIKVYNGGRTYKQWEFIYNPLEQVQTISIGSRGPGATQPRNQPAPFSMPQRPPMQQPPQTQNP